MPDLGDTLSRQVGPLPVGGWLLAVAGGLGVAYMLNRDAPEPNPGTVDPGSDAGYGLTSRGGVGTDLAGDPLPTTPTEPVDGDDDEDGEPTTNTAWGVLAIRTGMGLGYGPIATNGAVSRYLTGQELTREQANMLDAIIREIGPPPNPVPTPRIGKPPRDDGSGGQTPTTPPPTPKPAKPTAPPPSPAPKPKVSGRIYTIRSGDTLWAIARRYYGSGSEWPKLWRANSTRGSDGIGLRSGDPDLIFPGERIRIP